MARDEEREVVYVERGEGSLRPILFGALLGMAVGFLFAPQSGEETRRVLRRRIRKARALAEEKVGELSEKITGEWQKPQRRSRREDNREEARSDLERRLDEARARRRTTATAGEEEEPVA
jgi:gas vesicle protein